MCEVNMLTLMYVYRGIISPLINLYCSYHKTIKFDHDNKRGIINPCQGRMLGLCWASDVDGLLTLTQQWFNISCLLRLRQLSRITIVHCVVYLAPTTLNKSQSTRKGRSCQHN